MDNALVSQKNKKEGEKRTFKNNQWNRQSSQGGNGVAIIKKQRRPRVRVFRGGGRIQEETLGNRDKRRTVVRKGPLTGKVISLGKNRMKLKKSYLFPERLLRNSGGGPKRKEEKKEGGR